MTTLNDLIPHLSLDTNKTKTCFWHRVTPGLYHIGDITVEQIYHNSGLCKDSHMWHVIIDKKSIISWAYLKDAKLTAHAIDRKVKNLSVCNKWQFYLDFEV